MPVHHISTSMVSSPLNSSPLDRTAAQIDGALIFSGAIPFELKTICTNIIRAFGNAFPINYNKIVLSIKEDADNLEEGIDGFTEISIRNRQADVELYIAPETKWKQNFTEQGKIALTFFHEVFLHALPDLVDLSRRVIDLPDQEEQHKNIYFPPNEKNAYHQAIKQVLPFLSETVRFSFLKTYAEDVRGNAVLDCPEEHKDEALAWADTLEEKADNIYDGFWRS